MNFSGTTVWDTVSLEDNSYITTDFEFVKAEYWYSEYTDSDVAGALGLASGNTADADTGLMFIK